MKTQSGISLFEFMICLLLTSTLLLGIDMLQVTSVGAARASLYFNTAMRQADAMINRILLSRGENMTDIFNHWNDENKTLLPRGRGVIAGTYPEYIVSVFWGGGEMVECTLNHPGASGCVRQYVRII